VVDIGGKDSIRVDTEGKKSFLCSRRISIAKVEGEEERKGQRE
jgi:hypothetical protein